MRRVSVYTGSAIAAYGFGADHPFGADRHDVFVQALQSAGLAGKVSMQGPSSATHEQLALFHAEEYIQHVQKLSAIGSGFLDHGDTPAVSGIFEAASAVVGTTLAATDALMTGKSGKAFVPIAGLHHASRRAAAGFCVFNDCGVVIEHLRRNHGLERIAYVDIDAHHGDGVFYAFEDAPYLYFADIHEDGRYLYPGTGAAHERGRGAGVGRKLNLPVPPGADDDAFMAAWARVEAFIAAARPEIILLQCGADSLAGDPITHLNYSAKAHAHAASRLAAIAADCGHGRVLAMGGGGYNRGNLARAWVAVVNALLYSE